MANDETLQQRRDEFEEHIWNHAEDPFQVAFDHCPQLSHFEHATLRGVLEQLAVDATDEQIAHVIRDQMNKDPNSVFILMRLVGLTRNKIIQDLKAATAGSGLRIPSSADKLNRKAAIWQIAGPYLARRLRTVLLPLVQGDRGSQAQAFEAMSQATWPGWIRQERAKRQGHEAEHRLASVFYDLDIPFEPKEKVSNPLCRDAQIEAVSFDLVSPGVARPLLCFKATVHTANIGQYGESKDALEMEEASKTLGTLDPQPTLMALIDGVGFRSNRAGLDGVLQVADEFCQFSTLWKAVVVYASRTDRRVTLYLPDPASHVTFLSRYSEAVLLQSNPCRTQASVNVGEAVLQLGA